MNSKLLINDIEQPFIYIYRLCRENNTPAYRLLSNCLEYSNDINPFIDIAADIRRKAINGTKFNTYLQDFNVPLASHPIYTTDTFIPDFIRESVTRVRLMSHNLKVETGRWSRIPRDLRVCQCNNRDIQTESHVLIKCNLSQNIRLRYQMLDFTNTNSLFGETTNILLLCKYVHEVLKVYT